jgi:hypothetical protein
MTIFLAGGLFEGGLFDEAPMGEVPVPEVSSIAEQQEAGTTTGTAASVHDESDEDMGDHFGGPASPMGGMRFISFFLYLLYLFVYFCIYLNI